MLHEQRRQTDRLVAQVLADQLVSARRFVALIEEQIKRLQDRVQAPRQFAACGNLEGNSRLADSLAGSDQTLRHRRRRSQERGRDFLLAKTAQRFERQGYLRFAWQVR